MKVGAQFYTLNQHCKTLESFSETLKRVADMGYTVVQISGTCEYEAEWLKEELKKNGLTCVLTHIPFDKMINDIDKVIADHKIFDCKHIGIGGMPCLWTKELDKLPANVEDFIAKAKPIAEKIKNAGCYFMYHNHDKEYVHNAENGKIIMERLSDAFAPDEMGFTLDTFWVKKGGYDPIAEINRLSGRLPCVHFKDMFVEENGESRFTWCGNGILDFPAIGDALKNVGTEYILIEQDKTFDDEPDPFKCLAKSKAYLESVGFEF